MKLTTIICSTLLFVCCALPVTVFAKPAILIVDGRNNHDWRTTTDALRATLESTGLFEVAITTAPEDKLPSPPREPKGGDANFAEAKARHAELLKGEKPALDAAWAKWSPDFSKYAAVVLNYNGPAWPEPMRKAFVEYVRGGGGVFLVHAANNGFTDWPEFNEMIGLGWRKAGFGVALTINPESGAVAECCSDQASGHGSKHPFVVAVRKPEHPVLRGLPAEWMHGRDELYHHMRGPAKNLTILASALSEVKEGGSGLHEPVLWETTFGKGRVLTCSLGHFWRGDTQFDSLYCAGFQTLLARGVEYVGTGKVTLDAPANFPRKDKPSLIEPHAVQWSTQHR